MASLEMCEELTFGLWYQMEVLVSGIFRINQSLILAASFNWPLSYSFQGPPFKVGLNNFSDQHMSSLKENF